MMTNCKSFLGSGGTQNLVVNSYINTANSEYGISLSQLHIIS